MKKSNQSPIERYKQLLMQELAQAREKLFAHVRALSTDELTELYATEMVKLKTIVQWKRQGRPGTRPCSYPDTSKINLYGREMKQRGVAIPYVTALQITDECLLCAYGLDHGQQEHDQTVEEIRATHQRVRANLRDQPSAGLQDLPEDAPPTETSGEMLVSPQTDRTFGLVLHLGLSEYTSTLHSIEPGYLAGIASHLDFIHEHEDCPPVMLDDTQLTELLTPFIPSSMSPPDQARFRAYFLAGWTRVLQGLVHDRSEGVEL